jgi:hypothetical protein
MGQEEQLQEQDETESADSLTFEKKTEEGV